MLGGRFSRRAFAVGATVSLAAPVWARGATPTIFAHGGGVASKAMARDLRRLSGSNPKLLISPYADDPIRIAKFETDFWRTLGWRNLDVLDLSDPRHALTQIGNADVVWFSGGFQKVQVETLASVPGVISALQRAYRAGIVMAGSSAGASVMSRLMISWSAGGSVYTGEGLGFLPQVVIDQHYRERDRAYRLQSVISANRQLIGLGLDEATWITHRGSGFEVGGRGRAHVVTWGKGGLTTQSLRRGSSYDIVRRAVI